MKYISTILVSLLTVSTPVSAQEALSFTFPPSADEIIAIEQGGPELKVELGRHYFDVKDYEEAFKWYKSAAEEGYATAQLNLGLIYSHGEMGIPRDYTLAYMWLSIGATNGSSVAKRWRKKVAGNISSKGIERAKVMAKTCIESNYRKCGS